MRGARQVTRTKADQRGDHPVREPHAEHATSHGDQSRFQHHLAKELQRPGAQRRTDGELLTAGRSACQHQSGQVRT